MKNLKLLLLLLLSSVVAASGAADSPTVSPKLICSAEPIVALVGGDVILPCYLRPPMGPGLQKVLWTRPGLNNKYIKVYQEGPASLDFVNPSYRNRASLFEDQLKDGNVSLKLSRVKVSDAGRYLCTHEAAVKSTFIRLTVGAAAVPVIQVSSNTTREVVLQCESKGWYPKPEVSWLDDGGNPIPPGSTEIARGLRDLYDVRSSVTVEKTRGSNLTCRVQEKSINQSREATVHVPDGFVDRDLTHTSILSSIATCIGLAALMFIEKSNRKDLSFFDLFFLYTLLAIVGCLIVVNLMFSVTLVHDSAFFRDPFIFHWIQSLTVANILLITGTLIKYLFFFNKRSSFVFTVLHTSLLGIFVVMFVVLLTQDDSFFGDQFSFYLNLCLSVVLVIADLMVIVLTVIKKYGLLRRHLSFYLTVIDSSFLGLLLMMLMITMIKYSSLIREKTFSHWFHSTAFFIVIADVILVLSTVGKMCKMSFWATVKQILRMVKKKDKDEDEDQQDSPGPAPQEKQVQKLQITDGPEEDVEYEDQQRTDGPEEDMGYKDQQSTDGPEEDVEYKDQQRTDGPEEDVEYKDQQSTDGPEEDVEYKDQQRTEKTPQ